MRKKYVGTVAVVLSWLLLIVGGMLTAWKSFKQDESSVTRYDTTQKNFNAGDGGKQDATREKAPDGSPTKSSGPWSRVAELQKSLRSAEDKAALQNSQAGLEGKWESQGPEKNTLEFNGNGTSDGIYRSSSGPKGNENKSGKWHVVSLGGIHTVISMQEDGPTTNSRTASLTVDIYFGADDITLKSVDGPLLSYKRKGK